MGRHHVNQKNKSAFTRPKFENLESRTSLRRSQKAEQKVKSKRTLFLLAKTAPDGRDSEFWEQSDSVDLPSPPLIAFIHRRIWGSKAPRLVREVVLTFSLHTPLPHHRFPAILFSASS